MDKLEIIYQDESVVAVNKPEGMLSVPGRGKDKEDSVATRIQAQIPGARVVHRLDCATSGIMLMAIGDSAQTELNRQFRESEVQKEYIAIVDGIVKQPQGVINVPIRGNLDDRPRQMVDYVFGKTSVTEWSLLSVKDKKSRLRLLPITGRTHQLRVHCMSIGHPIVGDRLYNDENSLSARMYLHAESVEFSHPESRQSMRLTVNCKF